MKQKSKDAIHRVSNTTRRDVARYVSTIAITICISLAYTGLSAQSKGFNDTVILKNGTVLSGVKAVVTKDSLVVTTSEGETSVFTKKEVSEVKKGDAGNGDKTEKVETKSNIASATWSDYQGAMNWEDAKKRCASLRMRLPKSNELVVAHNVGLGEKWQKEKNLFSSWHWTSEESSAKIAYYVYMSDGNVGSYVKGNDSVNVRCIR